MSTEKIKAIAEAMGYTVLSDPSGVANIILLKVGEDLIVFNPYESDADAFKVLEWIVSQCDKKKYDIRIKPYSVIALIIVDIQPMGSERIVFESARFTNEAISNAAYELITGE